MTAADLEPDTKDWTWVLQRPCPECSFVAGEVNPSELAGRIRDNADHWQDVLRRSDVRRRPGPAVWSPLEYGCHVRDVHRTMLGRVSLMLDEHEPSFLNWDQDATAVAERYAEQDPARVAAELGAAADAVAQLYEGVSGARWDRPGVRSNGSSFTVASLGRYHLHDVVHHLHDVAAG
jgi:hypothetical protein